MFKDEYKNAYINIVPKENYMDIIVKEFEKRKQKPVFFTIMRQVAATVIIMCLFSMAVLPVTARTIPAVYRILEKYAPSLSEFILPDEVKCSSNGIIMQVEAIDVKENDAEIIVSFSDEEGFDYINGKVDMNDSYRLSGYGAESNIGGYSFLEYDAEEDKAYFKVCVSSSDEFNHSMLTFRVYELLTKYSKEEKEIPLEDIVKNPKFKKVELRGISGIDMENNLQGYIEKEADSPFEYCNVLDSGEADESMVNELTVMGTAYVDGILRLQVCGGNCSNADRHLRPFLVDKDGNKRDEDCSVGWHEEVDGEKLYFSEHWFEVGEEELNEYKLCGIFYIADGSVRGKWKVSFRVK